MDSRSLFVASLSFLLCTLGVNSGPIGRCAQELDSTADAPALPGSFKPQCTDKGHYQLVQRHGSTGYGWCVDPSTGIKIEGTDVGPAQGDPECPACVTLLAKALDKILLGAYRPQCDQSGNFKRVQVSASTGLAWCADPQSGQKLTNPQRNDGTLRCDNANRKKRPAVGHCAQEVKATADAPSLPGAYTPQCTEKGHYQLIQRHGSSGYSWCVNPTTGVKIEGTDVAPGQGDPQCPACVALLAQANEKILLGAYRPQCDNAGVFKRVQFSASTGLAWCADPESGKQLTKPQRNDGTLKCDARKKRAAQGPCAQELEATAGTPALPGAFKPECTDKGNYKLIQHHSSTGYAWCVNPVTGVKVDGTEVAPGGDQPACPACIVQLAKATSGRLLGVYRPQCDSAGLYKPLQISASTGMAWCAETDTGKKIGDAQRWDGTLKC